MDSPKVTPVVREMEGTPVQLAAEGKLAWREAVECDQKFVSAFPPPGC